MNLRRTIVWIASALAGAASVVGVLLVFGTTLEKFSTVNALLVFLSMGSLTFIWLDFIFRTQYLRS
ncbi:MAG TPA: hypothetical protein VFI11_08725 [Anaerolineales bacterium]|nr:hypothetical protein [Anaerolineales bacterium]